MKRPSASTEEQLRCLLTPHFIPHPQSSPDGLYLVAVADDQTLLSWSDYERERAAADSLPPILWRGNRV